MALPPLPAEYIGTHEIAADLGVTLQAVYRAQQRGSSTAPPLIKVNGRLGVRREDYAAWKRARDAAAVAARLNDAVELRNRAAALEAEALSVAAS